MHNIPTPPIWFFLVPQKYLCMNNQHSNRNGSISYRTDKKNDQYINHFTTPTKAILKDIQQRHISN